MQILLCTPHLILAPLDDGWEIQNKQDRSRLGWLRIDQDSRLTRGQVEPEDPELLHEAAVVVGAQREQRVDPDSPLGRSLQEAFLNGDSGSENALQDICRQVVQSWQGRYADRVTATHRQLGLPEDYAEQYQLPMVQEPLELSPIGQDVFERPQFMAPFAARAWRRMSRSAMADGVSMFPVSAFRSLEYQASLVQKKVERGLAMDEILKSSAAPGYSEHHSGCAIDIDAGKGKPLEEDFEETDAFAWLTEHALEFGFRMSFPRDNPHGIAYEPWHWAYTPEIWMLNLS